MKTNSCIVNQYVRPTPGIVYFENKFLDNRFVGDITSVESDLTSLGPYPVDRRLGRVHIIECHSVMPLRQLLGHPATDPSCCSSHHCYAFFFSHVSPSPGCLHRFDYPNLYCALAAKKCSIPWSVTSTARATFDLLQALIVHSDYFRPPPLTEEEEKLSGMCPV
jgi:hypothetical protein